MLRSALRSERSGLQGGSARLARCAAGRYNLHVDLTRTIPVVGPVHPQAKEALPTRYLRVFRQMIDKVIPGKTIQDLRDETEQPD